MAIDTYLHFNPPPSLKEKDKAVEVESQDGTFSEAVEEAAVSPRDEASGLPTDKRTHTPQ